ncbi:hypothetical protein ABEB36_005071 [Hypothenemus hampei]|uniref:WD and tetratricopeptide repeats protein 1 n=1 Tax=Hypothenemus hampei TaxID=57062 RepID=A0ABD1EWW4_HYPHA
MDKKLGKGAARRNILQLIQHRENFAEASKSLQQHCQFTYDLIKRLGFEYELQGHQGCVNCLQWSSDGRLLASGSDDTQVMIWDPMKHKRVQTLSTNHMGNIFSVKFLGTNNSIVATAAGDGRVTAQSIDGTQILDCHHCHSNRVKRLANSPLESTVFWSAGEDGRVLQYDLRESHDCFTNRSSILLSFRKSFEVKCLAINPTKPHYLAVGANDSFVRLYDRRNIKPHPLSEVNDNEFIYPSRRKLKDSNCVQYFAPGHLAIDNSNVFTSRYVVTYITFNSSGSEMLVNMGGEQIYLFDINQERSLNEIRIPTFHKAKLIEESDECKCNLNSDGYSPNNSFDGRTKINKLPNCPCFYMRRGFHLSRRKWIGDVYCAARDYLYVTQKWPNELKAYVGLIKCLIALEWNEEARRWYEYLCLKYPDYGSHKQAQKLLNAITALDMKPKDFDADSNKEVDENEIQRRLQSRDYQLRFMGHCNTTTDIMEANFLGDNEGFICAGSDEGRIFIWERKTQSIVHALVGDVSIVNCLQPHPSTCLIASSGIDPVVKLWSPMPEDGIENIRVVKDIETVVRANQHRMALDPFETLLVNMGYDMEVSIPNAGEYF